jgi:hypothetical protein
MFSAPESVERVVTGWTSEAHFLTEVKYLLHSVQLSIQPHGQWVPGFLSPGVKLPGRESDHSPTTSVAAKNTWIYISTPPYDFVT